MHVNLSNQVAVVTGGAQGIGRAIVRALAANGAQVAIIDLDRAEAECARQEILEAGGTVSAFEGDVADAERMTEIARVIAESLLSHIPLGRPATVEEIAHAVLFLVAPESSYLNGVVLPVDGGWLAGYTRDW